MKTGTVRFWPQVEWTHNRWATKVSHKPHPSALITVDESHVTWPITPHYLDRAEPLICKRRGRRDSYHLLSAGRSSWGGWHFWRSSEARRWLCFVVWQLHCVQLMSIFQINVDFRLAFQISTEEKTFNCGLRWTSL